VIVDVTAVLAPVARWVGYLGAFLVLGGMVFRVAVLRGWTRSHPADSPVVERLAERAARLGLFGGMLLLLGAGGRLWTQLHGFVDPGEPITRELAGLVIRETPWGRGWIAQLGAAVLALGGYLAALAAPRAGWIAAGIGATLVAAVAPMTGHAMTQVAGGSGRLLDALHLLAGSAWLGTLLVTLVAGLMPLARLEDAQRGELSARLMRAFSPVALIGAVVAVVAGSILSWRYLGGTLAERLAGLTGSPWGQVLLVKSGILLLVAGVGGWNWRVLLPRLGSAAAAQSLQRSARVEVLLGLVLLAATAILVALPMPAEALGPME
jgi:copper transport protein